MKTAKIAFASMLCALFAFTGTVKGEILNLNYDWLFQKDGAENWEHVSVPHCVNAQEIFDSHTGSWGENSFWKGVMHYKKTLELEKLPAKAFLEIEAIRQTARVIVNGTDCGFYAAGISAIGFDISSALKVGANEIEIVTDNLTMNDEGGADYQWNEASFNPVQGGLTGNVRLHLKDNATYFTLPLYSNLKTKGTYIWADDFDLAKGEATVHIDAEVAGAKDDTAIKFTVNGQTFDGSCGRVKNLVFWSPDTPHLYDVTVELYSADGAMLDTETIRTGFRKIEYDYSKGGLFINGKNFTLPGYSQRSVNCWAAIGLPTDWLMDWEMALVRESNANHIRWMHVAPKPNAVRSCDKMGVVVTSPAGDREMQVKGKYWEQRVAAMRDVIIYFRNSPSIFFWEAGNNQIKPECMREMRLLKEELDPHNGRFMGCRTLQTPEQVAEAEYVGTMINRHDAGAFHSMSILNKYIPIMETEFCREEAPRRVWDEYSPPDFDYVNRWLGRGNRENGFDAHDKTQEDIARSNASDDGWSYFWGNRVNGKAARFYTGWAMLCWSDQIELGRNSASENSRVSGRVDAARIKKENFYVLKTLQSEVPAIKILGHWSYPQLGCDTYLYHGRHDTGHHWEWTDEIFQRDPKHKSVYVIGSKHVASMELIVNGKSKGIQTETKNSPFIYAFDDIDITESGYVEAIARDAEGNEIAREKIETAGAPAKIASKVTTGPEGWLADGSDIAMIDLDLVDAQGRLVPCATDKLEFTLEFKPSNCQTIKSSFAILLRQGYGGQVATEDKPSNCQTVKSSFAEATEDKPSNSQTVKSSFAILLRQGYGGQVATEDKPSNSQTVKSSFAKATEDKPSNSQTVKPSNPSFIGGYNSGTFKGDEKRPSPVGTNWVRFECGQTRVFLKAGFAPGDVTLKVKCENGLCTEIPLQLLTSNSSLLAPPQSYAPNTRDFTITPTAPQVREYSPKSDNLPPYTILVNGKKVDFHRNGAKPVKPDANTGVVAPYNPILDAMNEAGAGIKIDYVRNPKKTHKLPEYLKGSAMPYLKVTTADGHTIECVNGETRLFYDAGKEKNLANCEMFEDKRHNLVGEVMALLQYITNVKISIDDNHRILSIEIVK